MQAVTQLEQILRLTLALISGGILGFERSRRGIDAGFRTHIFVCMSSCAIMLTNIDACLMFGTGDPMRMPANVISGIGFLGAGCILVTGQYRIKGVTTAAGVWSAACLGLCIGAGNYIVAGFVLVMGILTLTVFRTVDDRIVTRTKYMRLYIELESVSALTDFLKQARNREIKVIDLEIMENKLNDNIAIVAAFQLKKPESVMQVMAELEKEDGVVYASRA